jgi:integrase
MAEQAEMTKQKTKRRVKGEGSLLKIKGCRFWYAQFYQDGRQKRVSTKTEIKRDALKELRRLMGDSERGLPSQQDLKKVTYEELRAGLLMRYTELGNKSLETLDDGTETIPGLKQLDEFCKGMTAASLTTNLARRFVKQRLAEGVGNAWINRSLACLRRMLRLAHKEGKIANVPTIYFMKEPEARKGFLERAKFKELLGALPSHLRPTITLLYWTGVRIGEAQQIEWPQVDLERGLIRLEEGQTKNDEPRYLPIPSVLRVMLEEMQTSKGRVFSTENLRNEWEIACAKVGEGTRVERVSEKGYKYWNYNGRTIHDLRRSALSNLIRTGTSEKEAMAISGHKTRSVFDRYHIVKTDDVTAAMRRLEAATAKDGKVISERLVKKALRK